MQSEKAYGALKVRATTARGALPVCGALVIVERCGGGASAVGRTDESGCSRVFELETKPAAIGESPACVRYDVEVIADGFDPADFHALPIYEGVTTLQCAELVPKLGLALIRHREGGGK